MSNYQTFPLWPDNPSEADLLGFGDIVGPIVDAVGRPGLDPVAIGVFGPWGSGKTTIIDLVSAALKKQESVVVVRVTPWEYDATTDIKATLIGEVLLAVKAAAEAKQGLTDNVKERLIALAKRVKWSKAISLTIRSAVSVSLPSLDDVTEIFGNPEEPVVEDPTLAGFRAEFDHLMKEIEGISRVVVVVDDLDRCLPEAVIASLEAIKLFLAVRKMAFVVAADVEPVVDAIKTRYSPSHRAETMARQYLEKIVQIPFRVPSLGESDTEAYLALLLLEHSLTEEDLGTLVEHCNSRRQKGVDRLLADLPGDTPEKGAAEVTLASALAPVLWRDLEGNPRRLKRFLNAFWLRSRIAETRSIELSPPALAKLIVLEELHPEAFKLVIRWTSSGDLESKLSQLEAAVREGKGSEEFGRELVDWASVEPPLADIGLGPYLRLAASMFREAVAGLQIRADLREVLEGLISEAEPERKASQGRANDLPLDDQLLLVDHLVKALRAQPNRQATIGESIGALSLAHESVATEVASKLQDFDPSLVQPALLVWLSQKGMHDPIKRLVQGWIGSGHLPEDSEKAAKKMVS